MWENQKAYDSLKRMQKHYKPCSKSCDNIVIMMFTNLFSEHHCVVTIFTTLLFLTVKGHTYMIKGEMKPIDLTTFLSYLHAWPTLDCFGFGYCQETYITGDMWRFC